MDFQTTATAYLLEALSGSPLNVNTSQTYVVASYTTLPFE